MSADDAGIPTTVHLSCPACGYDRSWRQRLNLSRVKVVYQHVCGRYTDAWLEDIPAASPVTAEANNAEEAK